MSRQLTIVMAQMNPIVGDLRGNADRIIDLARQAIADFQADVVVFPEMCLTGYPPEDVLLRPGLYPQVQAALDSLCAAHLPVALVVGYPMMDSLDERFNMAAWIENGQMKAAYMKQFLPNYGPFDEKRYFSPGDQACVVDYKGVRFGLLICEDIWKPTAVARTVEAGAEVLLNMNASPFHAEKHEDRLQVVRRRVAEFARPVIYVNQVGGQDELVFDGSSFAMDAEGEVLVQAPAFESGLTPVRMLRQGGNVALLPGAHAPVPHDEERLYGALVTGVRDFIDKNGITAGIVLGLSGGIDSALTLAVAVDALGPARCEAVMMPYHYTAQASIEDARLQAER
ncbi:MAG TPA: NAD+ synthase, partial [Piscirickettsiaceae bacterium]|nr:NAD+ synthase [Piscirickettsiaceae bacterium]